MHLDLAWAFWLVRIPLLALCSARSSDLRCKWVELFQSQRLLYRDLAFLQLRQFQAILRRKLQLRKIPRIKSVLAEVGSVHPSHKVANK